MPGKKYLDAEQMHDPAEQSMKIVVAATDMKEARKRVGLVRTFVQSLSQT